MSEQTSLPIHSADRLVYSFPPYVLELRPSDVGLWIDELWCLRILRSIGRDIHTYDESSNSWGTLSSVCSIIQSTTVRSSLLNRHYWALKILRNIKRPIQNIYNRSTSINELWFQTLRKILHKSYLNKILEVF